MTLKETVRLSIEDLDNDSLAILYEQIQRLKQAEKEPSPLASAPSLDEVRHLTSRASGSWSADVISDRADRA